MKNRYVSRRTSRDGGICERALDAALLDGFLRGFTIYPFTYRSDEMLDILARHNSVREAWESVGKALDEALREAHEEIEEASSEGKVAFAEPGIGYGETQPNDRAA